jgi:hypothetical protein
VIISAPIAPVPHWMTRYGGRGGVHTEGRYLEFDNNSITVQITIN